MVKSIFNASCDITAYEKTRLAAFEQRQHENMVANGTLDLEQVSHVVNPSRIAGENGNGAKAEEKRQRDARIFELALANIEANLIDKYGEDFAENWAAEFLDETTYERLMQIEDQEERRRQIAIELQNGIEAGTIYADRLYANPDIQEWMNASNAEEQRIKLETQKIDSQIEASISGEQTHNISQDAALNSNLNKLFGD